MTIAELARRAHARISKGWTQGYYATNKAGHATPPVSPDACAWCLMGACFAEGTEEEEVRKLRDKLSRRLKEKYGWHDGPGMWNDMPGRTVDEVKTLLLEVAG